MAAVLCGAGLLLLPGAWRGLCGQRPLKSIPGVVLYGLLRLALLVGVAGAALWQYLVLALLYAVATSVLQHGLVAGELGVVEVILGDNFLLGAVVSRMAGFYPRLVLFLSPISLGVGTSYAQLYQLSGTRPIISSSFTSQMAVFTVIVLLAVGLFEIINIEHILNRLVSWLIGMVPMLAGARLFNDLPFWGFLLWEAGVLLYLSFLITQVI